ncbi:uncharacterized protein EV154DRAFT_564831 [Mucor mucedo]|uniref:uncharacterized protein n=1 Tax=Mucor mucedo TaxID=29922 RepID=UPI0022202EF6|nr:uncharacterized protein EV154DRAFT_564831 [Mucor mucedo]KAI7890050.1 hypothetical protein EV154DRAFT_564831 [Mucor mucedo]
MLASNAVTLMRYWVNIYNRVATHQRSTIKIVNAPKTASVISNEIFEIYSAFRNANHQYTVNSIVTLGNYASSAQLNISDFVHQDDNNEPDGEEKEEEKKGEGEEEEEREEEEKKKRKKKMTEMMMKTTLIKHLISTQLPSETVTNKEELDNSLILVISGKTALCEKIKKSATPKAVSLNEIVKSQNVLTSQCRTCTARSLKEEVDSPTLDSSSTTFTDEPEPTKEVLHFDEAQQDEFDDFGEFDDDFADAVDDDEFGDFDDFRAYSTSTSSNSKSTDRSRALCPSARRKTS